MSSVPTPQGVGISWECANGSAHTKGGQCNTPGCRCACHYRLGAQDTTKREIVETDVVKVPNPPTGDDRNITPAAGVQQGRVCPSCSKPSSQSARFCRHCGARFVVKVFCENCGAEGTTADSYCEGCGAPLSGEVKVKSPRKKKVNGTV